MSLVYDVFRGTGGNPPDVSAPVATVSGLSWTDPAVAPGATTSYLVRARDTGTGLSDRNGDALVAVAAGPGGLDATAAPPPPRAVRALATRGGTARVEWAYPLGRSGPSARPLGFRVYLGVGTPDYASPRAVVPFAAGSGSPRGLRATLSGLADGVAYAVGVRAWNAAGEEQNTAVAAVVGSASAPANVASLAATATSTGR